MSNETENQELDPVKAVEAETTPEEDATELVVEEEVAPIEKAAEPDVDEAVVEFAEYINFESLNLHPKLLDRVFQIGWKTPTLIQQMCLPITLKGKDVAGFAQTGTGKTGVFLLTIANNLLLRETRNRTDDKGAGTPYALVVVPTRELAMQITSDASEILDDIGISTLAVYGGDDYEGQAKALRKGIDIVVATPGRLKDFYQKGILNFTQVNIFVCDEADRMFDMGFIEDIEFFFDKLPPEQGQKLMFSATTNEKVKELAFEYLENPKYLSANPEELTPHNVEQLAIICEAVHKVKVTLSLLKQDNPTCALIFTNTKVVAEWLHYKLFHNGIDAEVITGDLPQRKRVALITRIKKGDLKVLIATDVASRGLHIASVTHVYNFDLPDEPSNYIHRIGRTARAGASGKAISLVCEDYGHNLEPIRQLLGENIPIPAKWYDDMFLQTEDLSGNPYDDPQFQGNVQRAARAEAAKKERESRGGGDRGRFSSRGGRDGGEGRRDQRDTRGERGRSGPGGAPRDGGDRNRDRDRGRDRGGKGKGRDGQQPRDFKGQQRDGRGKPYQKSFDKRYDKKPYEAKPQAAAAKPVSSPSTIMGMLKKIVSVIFGIGRKK